MLMKFSSKFSKEILEENLTNWITTATKFIKIAPSNSQDLVTVCRTIGILIKHCKEFPEFNDQISISSVVKELIGIVASETFK